MARIVFITLLAFLANSLFGDDVFFSPEGRVKITEISNLTKKVNGKYVGLISRMDKAVYTPSGAKYKGTYYVSQELKHEAKYVEKPLEKTVEVTLSFDKNHNIVLPAGSPFPKLQNFPVLPAKELKTGDYWEGQGVRLVDPLNKGILTRINFYSQFWYRGITTYAGMKSYHIEALFSLRYQQYEDPKGDPELKEIKYAGHWVDIYIDAETGKRMIIIEKLGVDKGYQEEYHYSDGTIVTLSGNIITIYDDITPMKKDDVVNTSEDKIEDKKIKDVDVKKTEDGVKLSLQNLKFKADSPELLNGETDRLKVIADILNSVPEKTILVVGHTADFGTKESQQTLSEQRALAIVQALIKLGVQAGRFYYEGRGGTEPIAPNDTEANMAKNRRVEITILDD
jgi:outer membrane protein OmpA-like peptidoglycan-associated protein